MSGNTVSEVVIVGGGLAGLSAAFEAARRGHFVTILEASEKIGGRGTSTESKNHALNAGPHLLYRGGPLHVLLTKASKMALSGRRLQSKQFFRRDGGQWKPLSLSSSAIRGKKLPANTKLALLRLRRTLRKAAKTNPEQTYADWISQQPLELQDELSVWAKVSTWLPPEFGSSLSFHSERALHALWKRGLIESSIGWADIVGRLLSALDRLGVELCSQAKISTINLNSKGRVKSVQLDGGRRVKADAVILALPRKATVKIIQESGLDPLEYITTSVNATLLDLVIEGRFVRDGLLYDQTHDVILLNHYEDDSNTFKSVVSAMAIGNQDYQDRLNRIEATLDETASGWRNQVTLRRQTNNISIAGALPSESRPSVEHYGENQIFLAGDWIESEYWLADGAVDTGLRAGAMLQGRSA